MEPGFVSIVLLPIGLGLLGFVEPCTIGGHLLFLRTLQGASRPKRLSAFALFVGVRILVMGGIGAAAAAVGARLVSAQTTLWLVFGIVYLLIGVAYLSGNAGRVQRALNFAPGAALGSANPALLGIALGLNIPACAAPILFGLFGVAASVGSATTGFAMMALFGAALSMPLLLVAIWPRFNEFTRRMMQGGRRVRIVLGGLFVLLGLWSIWFGLFVDPVDWSAL